MASRTQTRARSPEASEQRGLAPIDTKARALEVENSLMQRRGQFVALLAGDEKLTDRFMTVVLDTVVRSRDLLEADPLSLLTSVRTAAMLGLEPSGVLGDGAIIARRDRNQGGKKIAAFQPMYRGLMRLARSSGQVAGIDAAIVYENDDFEILRGTTPMIRHVPTLDDDQGAVRGAYAFAKLTTGELVVRYWPVAKLLRHRDRFAKDSNFWRDHPEPMMMKTVVHDLMKYLPLGHTASLAVAVDESVDYGTPTPTLPNRTRLRALGDGETPENDSGAAVQAGVEEDTTTDPAAAPDAVVEPAVAVCGRPGPMYDGQVCSLDPGHDDPRHVDDEGNSWL